MAWNDAVVTNAGVALLRQVLSGETLTLDGAAGGTGTVSSASLMAQTALKDKKQTFSIVGMTNVDNGKKINLQVTNLDLETGYALNQVGIWAHVGTGEPVLYAILQDPTGITIPSKTEMQDFAMNLYAVIDFGNNVSVNLTIDATALVTRATLDEELNKKIDKGELGELAYKSKAEKTDLSDDVQTSLEKANTAVQSETDPTVPEWAKQQAKPNYSYSEIKDKPSSYPPSSHNHSANEINSGEFPIVRGGTGANTAEGARTNLAISDVTVPISNDVATVLGLSPADNPKVKDGLISSAFMTAAILNVRTVPSAFVTITLEAITLNATADASGLAVLYPPKLGTWNVKAVTSNNEYTSEVKITSITSIDFALPRELGQMPWKEIAAVSQAGFASTLFEIGDTKDVTFGTELTTVQIAGFEHDDLETGGKAKITFAMKNLFAATYNMNPTKTNNGGWKSSAMRGRMTTFLNQLPEDLKEIIKPVIKKSMVGNSTAVQDTVDSIWLFSSKEFGLRGYEEGLKNEGTQYPLYIDDASRKKSLSNGAGTSIEHWTRTASPDDTSFFYYVTKYGGSNRTYANTLYGVCLGFCI